jgi:Mg2+/Co2+ transporter CorC
LPQAGEIPASGDVFYVDQILFTVAQADERRILQIISTRNDAADGRRAPALSSGSAKAALGGAAQPATAG